MSFRRRSRRGRRAWRSGRSDVPANGADLAPGGREPRRLQRRRRVSAIAASFASSSATGASVRPDRTVSRVASSPGLPACRSPPCSSGLQGGQLLGFCRPTFAAVPAGSAVSGTSAARHRPALSRRGWIDAQQRQAWHRVVARPANTGSGGARRDGMLANSSWAARNKAAAPSPNTRIDIERTIAVNRKRKPGSMDASSAFGGSLRGPLRPRERGDHCLTDSHVRIAANQADLRVSQRFGSLLQNLRLNAAIGRSDGDFRCEASLPQDHGRSQMAGLGRISRDLS